MQCKFNGIFCLSLPACEYPFLKEINISIQYPKRQVENRIIE